MREFGPAKEREETWPFSSPVLPEHIATHTAALSAFPFLFHWRTIFRKIEVPRRSVSSSAILNTLRLKLLPLTDIPDSINSELSATQVRRLNRESHFCRA